MGFWDFLKAKRADSTPDTSDDFLARLAHGSDAEIQALIYRGERLSDNARQACANVLNFHFRAPQAEGRLVVKSSHTAGRFLLLIVSATWQDDEEASTIPLILTSHKSQTKVAGVMLPFDDLNGHLSQGECSQIGELSAIWILRKIQAKAN